MTASTSTLTAVEARRAARNASALAVASLASKAALFFWQLILAPWLGVSDYGVYGTVTALFAIAAAVPSFGMGTIIIRDVARHPEHAGKYLTATLFAQTLLALLAYIGVNVAARALGYEDVIRAYTAVAGISLIVDTIGSMCNDLLLARERMIATSIIEVGHIFVRIGLAWLVLVSGFGLLGVYVVTILTGLGRTGLLWLLVVRGGTRPEFPMDWSFAKPLLWNSLPLALTAFLGLAYQHVDKLLTTQMIGTTATGYLNAAFVIIFGVVNLLSTTILTATFPMMSRYYGDGKQPMFAFMVEKLTLFTLIISLPICLLLSLFAPDITVPLFGKNYAPAADVLRILIWFALVTMTANVFSQGMLIQNRQQYLLGVRVVGLSINIALLPVLLPRLGITGAPLASVIAETIVLGILAASFWATGWERGRLIRPTLRLAGVGLVTALVMLVVGGWLPVAGMLAGVGLYTLVGLWAKILAPDDWDLLYRMTSAMPGGSLILKYWRRDVSLNW